MRGGPRKGFGGPQPNSGRPPLEVPTKPVQVWLTPAQHAELKLSGGSLWLQGAMNLQISGRPDALAMLQLDALEKKHGREWLVGLAGKINERVKNG